MGVEIDGLTDVFGELEELEREFGESGSDWVVGTNVDYAPYLEFGSSPHVIRAQDAEALRFRNQEGDVIYRISVHHPGTDPTPFFRPAANEVRLQGGPGFIRHNTNRSPEAIDSAREYVATLAFALQRRIQEIIRNKGLIDTGNLRASVRAVPAGDTGSLPDAEDVSPGEVWNPLEEYDFSEQ